MPGPHRRAMGTRASAPSSRRDRPFPVVSLGIELHEVSGFDQAPALRGSSLLREGMADGLLNVLSNFTQYDEPVFRRRFSAELRPGATA